VVLELDHVIRFVPAREAVDLTGFTVEPGRVHTGQGTRNVRVIFDRNYLEILWVEHPDEVVAQGLDFIGRCARPATAYPFGCVLRGTIPPAESARFVPYQLPDAPGVVLQRLAAQPPDAPFIAIFEMTDREAAWPAPRVAPGYLAHPNGATRIVRATFTCSVPPPLADLADVRFASGEPCLDLDLGSVAVTYLP
jgi:hypothetical protein